MYLGRVHRLTLDCNPNIRGRQRTQRLKGGLYTAHHRHDTQEAPSRTQRGSSFFFSYLAVDGWLGRPGFSLPIAVELAGTLAILLALHRCHLGGLVQLGILHLLAPLRERGRAEGRGGGGGYAR